MELKSEEEGDLKDNLGIQITDVRSLRSDEAFVRLDILHWYKLVVEMRIIFEKNYLIYTYMIPNCINRRFFFRRYLLRILPVGVIIVSFKRFNSIIFKTNREENKVKMRLCHVHRYNIRPPPPFQNQHLSTSIF